MANTAKVMTDYSACTAPALTDIVLGTSNLSGNAVTVKISIDNLYSNSAANLISCKIVSISESSTPANSADVPAGANTPNSLWSDGDYIYYYDGTSITRAALSSF